MGPPGALQGLRLEWERLEAEAQSAAEVLRDALGDEAGARAADEVLAEPERSLGSSAPARQRLAGAALALRRLEASALGARELRAHLRECWARTEARVEALARETRELRALLESDARPTRPAWLSPPH